MRIFILLVMALVGLSTSACSGNEVVTPTTPQPTQIVHMPPTQAAFSPCSEAERSWDGSQLPCSNGYMVADIRGDAIREMSTFGTRVDWHLRLDIRPDEPVIRLDWDRTNQGVVLIDVFIVPASGEPKRYSDDKGWAGDAQVIMTWYDTAHPEAATVRPPTTLIPEELLRRFPPR